MMVRKNELLRKIDKFIGNKVCELRLHKGMSRKELAVIIGVSSVQLQKYEQGLNSIAVGRFIMIARALSKEFAYFEEGIEEAGNEIKPLSQHQRMCLEFSRNFRKIIFSKYKKAVNDLIKVLASHAA